MRRTMQRSQKHRTDEILVTEFTLPYDALKRALRAPTFCHASHMRLAGPLAEFNRSLGWKHDEYVLQWLHEGEKVSVDIYERLNTEFPDKPGAIAARMPVPTSVDGESFVKKVWPVRARATFWTPSRPRRFTGIPKERFPKECSPYLEECETRAGFHIGYRGVQLELSRPRASHLMTAVARQGYHNPPERYLIRVPVSTD